MDTLPRKDGLENDRMSHRKQWKPSRSGMCRHGIRQLLILKEQQNSVHGCNFFF